jgi:CDP-diacylglycerol--glycerol-3-phosphate 3-phosphatidyltransferase
MNDVSNPEISAPQRDDLEFATTPNLLTTSRVIFVPIVVALLFQETPFMDFLAALAFTVAAITDYFDGYLARRNNSESVFGKLMDPLADKFLVVSSLCMLQELARIHPVVVILLICREMAITGLRALASSEGLVIGASNSAKWKTATQMVAIPLLILKRDVLGIPLYAIGQGLLYVSLAISLWSAKDYVVDFFKAIREKRRRKKEAKLAKKLSSQTQS